MSAVCPLYEHNNMFYVSYAAFLLDSKPQNPVFSIDLQQVIENDKAVEKAHEIALAKINSSKQDQNNEEEEEEDEEEEQNTNDQFNFQQYHNRRRLSDPIINYSDIEVSDYTLNALRTIDTLKEEEEEELIQNRRKSRLIEALTLSSTSASSVCILDKDLEFKPPKSQVPKVIIQTVDYITKHALNTVGIFRTGGSHKRVKQVCFEFPFVEYYPVSNLLTPINFKLNSESISVFVIAYNLEFVASLTQSSLFMFDSGQR